MQRYLVVTNQTSGSTALFKRVRHCMAEGPCRFHVVVPATAVHDRHSYAPGDATTAARRNLDGALARFRAEGATATGEVGPADAFLAVQAALAREDRIDEIIVSTLPAGISRWLHQDLVHRLARATKLPVTHVTPTPRRRGRLA
jgi:hypothetical protein